MKGMVKCIHNKTQETIAYLNYKELCLLDPAAPITEEVDHWIFYPYDEYERYYPLVKDLEAFLILKELKKEVEK